MRCKIQTNDYNVNVVVEIQGNKNHIHTGPGDYFDSELLTDEQIEEEYNKLIGKPSLEDMKNKLKKIKGFAISNVNGYKGVKYGSIIKYDLKSN